MIDSPNTVLAQFDFYHETVGPIFNVLLTMEVFKREAYHYQCMVTAMSAPENDLFVFLFILD